MLLVFVSATVVTTVWETVVRGMIPGQSRRHGRAFGGLALKRSSKTPKLKHYKSVKLLLTFWVSSPPAQTQSPPIENFLATVLFQAPVFLRDWQLCLAEVEPVNIWKIFDVPCFY